MIYVGIDNGVSGSIGVVDQNGTCLDYFITPTFTDLNYTKKKKNMTRIDTPSLRSMLKGIIGSHDVRAFLERPMVNPGRFNATVSAVRALEATLIVLGRLNISVTYVDSREWQAPMLPKGSKGDKLKEDSMMIGMRLFPKFQHVIKKQKDADGLLIAEWARRERK